MFVCIDALDECAAGHRIQLLNSLEKIIQNSPSIRIFVTGRSHIRQDIGRHLSKKVGSVSVISRRGDIIRYLHSRLKEDTTPDAMDSSLEADILKKIPQGAEENLMCVEEMTLVKLPQVTH